MGQGTHLLIESHANLHHERLRDDVHAVINRAVAHDIGGILNICCDRSEFESSLAMCDVQDDIPVWTTIGIHPHHAANNADLTVDWLVERAESGHVIAIGETGLDYHYDFSPRDAQMRNLDIHMEAVRETGLPMVIHTREADQDMERFLLQEMEKEPFDFELHSYTSGARLAEVATELGAYFSVNGIATFKNAADVRSIIQDIMPDDRIMLETDCPYLAPVPHRGRCNEPAYLSHVRDLLADLKGWSLSDTETRTTDAFFRLFSKAQRP